MKTKYSRLVAGLALATTVALLGKGAVATAANSTNDNTRTVQRGGANVKKSAAAKKTSTTKKVQVSTAETKTSAKTPAKNTAKKVATKAPASSSSSSKSQVASSSAKSAVKSSVAKTSTTSSSHAATSSKVASSSRTAASSSTRRVATRTATRTAAKPAVRRNTISFAGVTMSVITGSMSVTTAPSGNVAQTWGGQTHLSVTDGQSTHIIGHNTSSFGRIMALGAGSPVTVTDGNGNTRTYHVYSVKNVTDQGYIEGTNTSVYGKIVSANQGEQVVLQTCISSTVNRLVWAR
ncbi:sortase domain-containing protein [Lacticaseibacillus sharpeae]|nr:sortase [Lacticaseibacillus sharpeae]